jgi:hypothetical protein
MQDGKELPGSVYAKVIDAVAGSGNSFYLRFTSVSPEIERLFRAQTADPKTLAAPFQSSNGTEEDPNLAPTASGSIRL